MEDVQECSFVTPTTAGVELTVAGPYTFVNLGFVGTSGSGPYDVNNTYGSSITVTNTGPDSNSQYYTGSTVVFEGSVTITITVKNKGTLAVIVGAQTSVQLLASPYTQIMNEDTIAGGIAIEAYTGSTPVDVVVKVRKSDSADDPRYFAESSIDTIAASTGLTKTVLLTENPFI